MIEVKKLTVSDITPDLLLNFHHRQIITKKWINRENKWELAEASDLREWDRKKRMWIADYLCRQIQRGGSVVAAFSGRDLIGFCSIDGCLSGAVSKYANMTMLFVDDGWKRKGVGKTLFREICQCAAGIKAEKLFISAIPSFDTVAFYFSMGCVDAKEIIPEYIDTDQDRYLECPLIKG